MKVENDLTALWRNAVAIRTDRDPFTAFEVRRSSIAFNIGGVKGERQLTVKESGLVNLVVHSQDMPASYLKNDPWFVYCRKREDGDELWDVGLDFEKLREVKGEHSDAAQSIVNEVRKHSGNQNIHVLMAVKHNGDAPGVKL